MPTFFCCRPSIGPARTMSRRSTRCTTPAAPAGTASCGRNTSEPAPTPTLTPSSAPGRPCGGPHHSLKGVCAPASHMTSRNQRAGASCASCAPSTPSAPKARRMRSACRASRIAASRARSGQRLSTARRLDAAAFRSEHSAISNALSVTTPASSYRTSRRRSSTSSGSGRRSTNAPADHTGVHPPDSPRTKLDSWKAQRPSGADTAGAPSTRSTSARGVTPRSMKAGARSPNAPSDASSPAAAPHAATSSRPALSKAAATLNRSPTSRPQPEGPLTPPTPRPAPRPAAAPA